MGIRFNCSKKMFHSSVTARISLVVATMIAIFIAVGLIIFFAVSGGRKSDKGTTDNNSRVHSTRSRRNSQLDAKSVDQKFSWDEKRCLKELRNASSDKKKQINVSVKDHNDFIFAAKYYCISDTKFQIDDKYLNPNSTKISTTNRLINQSSFSTEITVENIDCLVAAKTLIDQGLNPVVLNMANASKPGGGYTNGANAQEEDIFRRSTYSKQLVEKGMNSLYPINQGSEAIYTPDVLVIRGQKEKEGYRLLDESERFQASFIAVAAIDRKLILNDLLNKYYIEKPSRLSEILKNRAQNAFDTNFVQSLADDDKLLLKSKCALYRTEKKIVKGNVEILLQAALSNNHDSIVLSALGCGAFSNPPDDVAKIFKDVLNDLKFKNKFRRVVFAIYDDHNTGKCSNPYGNFKPFQDIFSKP